MKSTTCLRRLTNKPCTIPLLTLFMLLSTAAASGQHSGSNGGFSEIPSRLFFEKLETVTSKQYLSGQGTVTSDGHPRRPDDVTVVPVAIHFSLDPARGEAALIFESGQDDDGDVDSYYIRRGRIFQVDDEGHEVTAASLGDLSRATVAALHPELVVTALKERRDAVRQVDPQTLLFAWNEELWTIGLGGEGGRQIISLSRRLFHDIFGDGEETIRYTRPDQAEIAWAGVEVVVSSWGRTLANLKWNSPTDATLTTVPDGDKSRDRARLISADDVDIRMLANGIYSFDVAAMNTRVIVAEFTDFLVVLEGVYNSRNVDIIASLVKQRFESKPVRYFAFSHLHGQYIGGVRSWVSAGATILIPPSTAPLVERMVRAGHELRPDALSSEPRSVKMETVTKRFRLSDNLNALDFYSVESQHTDEYLLFFFPRSGLLVTGDLMFYRTDRAMSGRSLKLCQTIDDLGLEIVDAYATWPLAGYGTENHVSGIDLLTKCEEK